jgi:hypothetical protein
MIVFSYTKIDLQTKVVTVYLKDELDNWATSVANYIPSLSDEGVLGLKEKSLAFDWQDTESDITNYIDVEDNISVFPTSPGVNYIFNWVTKLWEPSQDTDAQWYVIKKEQRLLLNASDWRIIKAVDTGEPIPTNWQTYRQQLRDVTLQPDPFNITWPIQPLA